MKNGKNPTLRQKRFIEAAGLDPNDWLVYKVKADLLQIIHRKNESTKIINA
ncbi:hypothetical protein SAMN05661091_4096 [Paenibacillus uliginis N3/975]|uniref:DUF6906 domain-containing protein n=1 Tax=Paenibacillus uliginis N3/975 TaxID=1313296 RepID=A0A1X7HL55_9BACL|nr:hypothetical protein [Paenibacillus uliginis]SMF88069.1 hypothetical protein SAMN05661091_4096 [Paenibacillus uliginis N3/975]